MKDICIYPECGQVVLDTMWHVTLSDGSKMHGECVQEYGLKLRLEKERCKNRVPRFVPDDGEPIMIRERAN